MKTRLFNIIIFVCLGASQLGAQGLSQGYKTLDLCRKNYAEILQAKNQTLSSLIELPSGLYLARSITQSLEKDQQKYFSYQSLLSKKIPDVCYEGQPTSIIRTQAFIPTLIDQTQGKKLGHTYWTFSFGMEKQSGTVKANRSLIPNSNYKSALETQGYKIISSQKNHEEFQIHLERTIASWKETIVIVYDQF